MINMMMEDDNDYDDEDDHDDYDFDDHYGAL